MTDPTGTCHCPDCKCEQSGEFRMSGAIEEWECGTCGGLLNLTWSDGGRDTSEQMGY